MKSTWRLLVMSGICASGAVAGCSKSSDSTSPSDPSILVEKDVGVGSNGGAAHVTFTGTSGSTIRITLTAISTSVVGVIATMQPYGALERPGGADAYMPPLETAQSGRNTADLTLTESGRYTLTIFDGSGAGGTIHVKVQVVT